MTIEQFYETLQFLRDLENGLEIETNLEEVRDALNSLVSSPAHPQHQSALASALETFSDAVSGLKGAVTPSQSSAIAAIGGIEFFNPDLYESVKAAIATNAMTPSVARDFVKDLASRRAEFLETVATTLKGLDDLGVRGDHLQAGTADMAFRIPRDLFSGRLGLFAKELIFINRLIEHIAEAVNADAEAIKLETLSSSTPTVVVTTCGAVILSLGKAVEFFLASWEKVEKIRKLRAEIAELGMKGKAFDEFSDEIKRTVKEVVERSTRMILENFKSETPRKNELEGGLKQDLHRLYGQIERGLTIQFRAEPPQDGNAPEVSELEAVKRMGHEMQFPTIDEKPMLLSAGDVLDGDLESGDSTANRVKTTPQKTRKAATKDKKPSAAEKP